MSDTEMGLIIGRHDFLEVKLVILINVQADSNFIYLQFRSTCHMSEFEQC